MQTLLFLTRLPTQQDGYQNRDKVYFRCCFNKQWLKLQRDVHVFVTEIKEQTVMIFARLSAK